MIDVVQQLVRHTRIQEIVGDVIRVHASGVALGDMAEVDACMPRARPLESLRLIKRLIDCDYSAPESPEYQKYKTEIEQAVQQQVSGGP